MRGFAARPARYQRGAGIVIIPVSAVIATRNRALVLRRTLDSLSAQRIAPAEVIVVDGSDDNDTAGTVATWTVHSPEVAVSFFGAKRIGAAAQRIQGLAAATQPFVWFFDDDILFEPDCVARLWDGISTDARLGGVNAMIVNQKYSPPGRVSRTMFALMRGRRESSYAGKVLALR